MSAAMRLAGRPPMRRRGSMVRWLARLFTPAHYWPLSRCTSSGMCRPTSDAAEVSLVWRDDTSSVRAVVPGLHEGCRRTEAWSGRSVEPWPVLPKQLTQSVCLSNSTYIMVARGFIHAVSNRFVILEDVHNAQALRCRTGGHFFRREASGCPLPTTALCRHSPGAQVHYGQPQPGVLPFQESRRICGPPGPARRWRQACATRQT